MAATAAINPARTYMASLYRLTLTPANRAATGFQPEYGNERMRARCTRVPEIVTNAAMKVSGR